LGLRYLLRGLSYLLNAQLSSLTGHIAQGRGFDRRHMALAHHKLGCDPLQQAWPDTPHTGQLGQARERPMLLAIGYDAAGEHRPDARDVIAQRLKRCSVDVDHFATGNITHHAPPFEVCPAEPAIEKQ
jgi:hypothetical protein